MPTPRPRFLSEVKSRNGANRLRDALLTDPAFQEALQNIRAQFHVPYPATPEEQVRWYTQYFGGWNREAFWEAVADTGPEFQQFFQAVDRYCIGLEAKYNIPLTLTWSLRSPFDQAVDAALTRLGLLHSFKEEFVAYLFSDHPSMMRCETASSGMLQSRVAGITQYTLSFSTYDSATDIAPLFSLCLDMRKSASRALKGRPAQVSDAKTLERLILDAVHANDALPKGPRVTREALRTQLWQETRDKRLHTLSKAGFTLLFFSTLKTHGLTKRYMHF